MPLVVNCRLLLFLLQLDESGKELMSTEQDDNKFYASEKKSMSLPNVPLEGETNNKCKSLLCCMHLAIVSEYPELARRKI